MLACLVVGAAIAAWSACMAAETDAARIEALIRQLGSEKFEDREAAG